jgi:hypothetical protein
MKPIVGIFSASTNCKSENELDVPSSFFQADLLRQQTLQQMHRILTTRQAARALLVINDYFARLKALSSLWLARPRDS